MTTKLCYYPLALNNSGLKTQKFDVDQTGKKLMFIYFRLMFRNPKQIVIIFCEKSLTYVLRTFEFQTFII